MHDRFEGAYGAIDRLRTALVGPAKATLLLEAASLVEGLSDHDALHVRALVLASWRRYREAMLLYAKITASAQAAPVLLLDAGWCAHLVGQPDTAVELLDRAVGLAAEMNAVRFARGVVQLARGMPVDARIDLLQVAAADPRYEDVWLNLSKAESALGNVEAAERALRMGIEHAPRSASAWCQLGRGLLLQGKSEEAFAAYLQARTFEHETGDDARTTALHVVGLYEVRRPEAAVELAEDVLPQWPDATANTAYALSLLTLGEYQAGWEQYEFRWFDEPMYSHRVRYDRPFWTGQALAGKTILLRGEQGIGDFIQFARYASHLKLQGASVMVHAREGLAALACGIDGVDVAVETLELPPKFDYYINLLSVPRVVGTTLASVPAEVPYLAVPEEATGKWRSRLDAAGLRVGLVWSGNPNHPRDAHRSMALKALAPLWDVEGIRFFSLQKDVRPSDAPHFPPDAMLQQLGPELADLTDAAAVINELDLLIAVDTSLAHIAGALGKPVWLLLPEHADFRWLRSREDSPWYPTMRLVRQRDGTGWQDVIARVRDMLGRVVAGERCLLRGPEPKVAEQPRKRGAERVSRVTEMRDGIMQYIPELDDEARALARYGEYLAHELDIAAVLLPVDGWVVEVGSGVGSHALWLARTIGAQGQVLLYEARPTVARVLRQNLEFNRLIDVVTLPRGVLESDSLPERPSGSIEPVHTIDHLDLERLELLKIRASGALRVLDGAETTLWRLRPRLMITVQDASLERQIVERIRGYGYRIWRAEAAIFREDNFNRWPEDVFSGRRVVTLVGVPEETDIGMRLAHLSEVT